MTLLEKTFRLQLIVFWLDGSWWNIFFFSRRFLCHLWRILRPKKWKIFRAFICLSETPKSPMCSSSSKKTVRLQLIVFWWFGSWWNDFSFLRRFFCHLWMSLRSKSSKYLAFYISSDIILNSGWLFKAVLFHWVLVCLGSGLKIFIWAFGLFLRFFGIV